MKPVRSATIAAFLLASCQAVADVPRVVTDVAPVQSLVAQVMGDLGDPELVLPPGASPHGHAMRPSEARSLSRADVVFWVGGDLTPWLEKSIRSLAGRAVLVELSDLPGLTLLDFREGASFEQHDHSEHDEHTEHEDHSGESHDEHADHASETTHADHAADDDHGEKADHEPHTGHSDDPGHESHAVDPHLWLDPENARIWIDAIVETLSRADPENAATYAENGSRAQAALDDLTREIEADLAPVRDVSFVVFHDAYHYFENRFGIPAAGAISISDAADPSAARVAEVRDLVRDMQVTCVASEPQFNPSLVQSVAEGSDIVTTVLDPVGVGIEPGPGLYSEVLRGLVRGFRACLVE